ncbi:sigma-70 family RNA polymerase sigma factor [Antarcticibacterium sp. 1MA-6-2]|nr:sigma-70 family RNA polymerase sigma factor [Antarcticibacterium sp. 1MA-6-2]
MDRLRKISTTRTSELVEDITEDILNHVESGLESMLNDERSEIIKRCILRLPEQEAVIITLYYFEEQSVKEIAQVMKIGEDNVKVKLFRSRKLLFTFLENYINQEKLGEQWKSGLEKNC